MVKLMSEVSVSDKREIVKVPSQKDLLKNEIISYYKLQGLNLNEGEEVNNAKNVLRSIHQLKRTEELIKHKTFLADNFNLAKSFALSGGDVDVNNIELELVEIKSGSDKAKLFLWWNLIWWSLPFERPVGRQMRFMLWDVYHDAPFGIIGLQSPMLSSSVRDSYLGITGNEKDYWINRSLYGQRIGSLPPYNDILGGKMTAMTMSCNEIRNAYEHKYLDRSTLLKNRILPNELLFMSTTGAFGKSSMYERLSYNKQNLCDFVGYTSGAGTFQLSETLYKKCLNYLSTVGYDVSRGYGTGPSRKLKLISITMSQLGMPNYHYHNIKRGFYLFPLVNNLHKVIHERQEPSYYNYPLDDLYKYWHTRWCIPRSQRCANLQNFNANDYFDNVKKNIDILP